MNPKSANDPADATLPLVIGDWQATVETIPIDNRCEEVAARYGVRLDVAPALLAVEQLLALAESQGDPRLRRAAHEASVILRTLEVESTADGREG